MKRFPLSSLVLLAALAVSATTVNAAVDINGGSSWGGWTHLGNSLDVGIWGKGSTTRSYELYTTSFMFNNNTFDSSPGGTQLKASGAVPVGFAASTYSTGAFANGHTILGLGLKMNGSANNSGPIFLSFGLQGNDFQAASALGASDGRVDDTVYTHAGDFSVWMDGTGAGPSNLGAIITGGTANGGTGAVKNLPGGFGSGVNYDYAFREFRYGDVGGTLQMFFDLTAMQDLYGEGNTLPWNPAGGQIGTIGSAIDISMYNTNANWGNAGSAEWGNANQVVFSAPGVSAVPEPASLSLLGLGAVGLLTRRRKA